jgi:isopentenyl diphosphate isomerase/L-lactate dehydrogenase-like FMN-dependent dehydrogenase
MIDAQAAAYAGQDGIFFGVTVFGDDLENRLTDHLAGRPAEHALGCRVPGHDYSVQILADNGVVRGVDYCREVLLGAELPLFHYRVLSAYDRGGRSLEDKRMIFSECPLH